MCKKFLLSLLVLVSILFLFTNLFTNLQAEENVEIVIQSGHTSEVYSVTFSPDGKNILSGSDDRTVCLWDRNTGKQIRIFKGHTDSVSSVTFSPDGKNILS